MLVSFSVTNFRSIGEEVTLNMVASNKLTDHEHHLVPIADTGKSVLRTAIIYGANAAGKSNLIKAMDAARRLICESQERRLQITPFRFQLSDEKTPSSFEFQILLGDHVFAYGFDITVGKINAEWLTVARGESDEILFERTEEGAVVVPETGFKQYLGDMESYNTLFALKALQIRSDQLFLNRALSIPEAVQGRTLSAILKWFTTSLIVLSADSRSMEILDLLHNDNTFRSFCAGFLNNVGTGVGGFDVSTSERDMNEWERRYPPELLKQRSRRRDSDVIPNPDSPGSVIVRRLLSEHHISPESYYLPFSEESDGTQALTHLLPILANSPEESRVVVLDELDRSLHPLICWEFIRFFSEACPGAPRQLIVTTHEAHLLNQELLRRDEYWFAEKDDRQQTKLVSLLDFNIRKDLKIERGYMKGRFGAIPLICGMRELESLLECHESEVTNATKKPPS